MKVNGEKVDSLMWDDFAVDITSTAKPGRNEICLELYSSNRNFLGHHHHPSRDLELLAADCFDECRGFTEEYAVIRYGLSELPQVLIWSE